MLDEKGFDNWAGDYDESEVYPVIQELSQEIEGLRFIKISPCSGVCIIKK